MEQKPIETHNRSIIKSISYRVINIGIDLCVAYFFTRDATVSVGIVLLVNAYSTFIYYFHERAWAHIHWGRTKL